MHTIFRTALLSSAVALAVFPAHEAKAAGTLIYVNTASDDCKGSSGFGAQSFYFAPTYMENTSGSGQYALCTFAKIYNTAVAYPAGAVSNVNVTVWNPIQASGSAITYADTKVVQPGYAGFNFNGMPAALSGERPIINCLVPAGGRLVSINHEQPLTF